MRQKSAQADGRVDHRGNQRGGAGIELGHHHHPDGLGFTRQVGPAIHQHGGCDALELQVVAARHTLFDDHVAAHKVKTETFAEDISKIERQSPRQGLQAQHAEQFGNARLGFEKLPALDVHHKGPRHRGVIKGQWRALPGNLPLHLAAAPAHHVFHAQAGQQQAGISQLEPEVHRGSPSLRRCPKRLAWCDSRHIGPAAGGNQAGLGHDQVELVEPPFPTRTFCPGSARGPKVDRVDFKPAHRLATQDQVCHHHVKRRYAGRLLCQQRLYIRTATRHDKQAGQPGVNPPGIAALAWAVLQVAIEFAGIQVGTPQLPVARTAQHQVAKFTSAQCQLLGPQGQAGGQVARRVGACAAAPGAVGSGACGRTGNPGECDVPCIQVEHWHIDIGQHALIGHGRRFLRCQPNRDAALQNPGCPSAQLTHKGHGQQLPQFQLELVTQPY